MRKTLYAVAACILFSFITLPIQGNSQLAQADSISLDPVHITAFMFANGTTGVTFDAHVHNVGESSISTISVRIDSLDIEILAANIEETSTASITLSG